MPPEKYTRLF